jgi:hypothetical protein
MEALQLCMLTEVRNTIWHKTHISVQESSHIGSIDYDDLEQPDQPRHEDGNSQPYDDNNVQGIDTATALRLERIAGVLKRTSTHSSLSLPPPSTTFQLAWPSSENVNLHLAILTATRHNHGNTILWSSETSPLPTTKIDHVTITCSNEEAFLHISL